ncbi:MAG: helix-turn-helix transcriptional regulator [Halobacteriovoraceae bacterium]|nr:helix-turn-helix transcriptional regulator [Halobacteriovoraceae bacterium]
MAEFNKEELDNFLGVVRKYMQVRGPMSQKDLAESVDVGVSTMSRFLNQKTNDLNPQLIAKIVAFLEIPLHEIIDFVDEGFTTHFKKLILLYKNTQDNRPQRTPEETYAPTETFEMEKNEDPFVEGFSGLGTAERQTQARVSAGGGRKQTLIFESDESSNHSQKSIRDKLQSLTPRQKAYMTDFLNLDMEGRDFIVDLGNSILTYIRRNRS